MRIFVHFDLNGVLLSVQRKICVPPKFYSFLICSQWVECHITVGLYCQPCHVIGFRIENSSIRNHQKGLQPLSLLFSRLCQLPISTEHIGFPIIIALIISAFAGTGYGPHSTCIHPPTLLGMAHKRLEKIGYLVQKSQQHSHGRKGWRLPKSVSNQNH